MVMLPLIIRPMVWSSRALATASAAILPPAPTLFSTITGWPRALDSGSLNVRAVRSGEDPAGKPTMILSGLVGQAREAAARAISSVDARRETTGRDDNMGRGLLNKNIQGPKRHGAPELGPREATSAAGDINPAAPRLRRTPPEPSSSSSLQPLQSAGCARRSRHTQLPARATSCRPYRHR